MAEAEARGAEPAAPGEVRIRRALLSVSDKRGLVDFARGLVELGVEIVSTGGFGEVTVGIEVMSVRYPSASEFVRREAACSPLAGPLGKMSAESRKALVEELERALRPRTDDEGIVLPLEVYVARARR